MKPNYLFLGCGLLVGIGLFAGYHYSVGDHRALTLVRAELEETQKKLESLQKAQESDATAKLSKSVVSTANATSSESKDTEAPMPTQDTKKFTPLPSPESEKKSGMGDFMRSMVKTQMKKMQDDKLLALKSRLKLTPEQEEKVKAVLEEEGERNSKLSEQALSGEKMDVESLSKDMKNVKTLDQELDSILTPEQKANYEIMKKEEQKSQIEMMANFEVSQTAHLMGLNEQQKDQFYAAVYQAEEDMRKPDWYKQFQTGSSPSTDPNFYTEIRDKKKLDAVQKVLTPEQFEIYKKHVEAQSQMAKEMMKRFMPAPKENTDYSLGK